MTPQSTHDDAALVHGLRALAEMDADITTPPHVEAAVMAGWDAAHAPRARSRARNLVRGAAAAAAGVAVVGAFALQRAIGGMQGIPPLPAAPMVSDILETRSDPAASDTGLVETPAASTPRAAPAMLVLVGEPFTTGEPVRVVRMRVAGSTIAAFGIRSVAAQVPESVELEVLVGEDGVARAVRVGL